MRLALLACAFAVAMTGAAFAQLQQINPTARAPALNASNVSPRHLELLRQAGLPPTGIRAATRVTITNPARPDVVLSFFNVVQYTPSRDGDGMVNMRGNLPTSDQSWVQISYQADATSRYILDCEVGGSATQFNFVRLNGVGQRATRETTSVTVANGRVAAIMQPRGSVGWQGVYLMGMGGESVGWNLRACDIVPVG